MRQQEGFYFLFIALYPAVHKANNPISKPFNL